MCLAKAYIVYDEGDELIAKNVTSVKVDDTQITLTTILNETKTVKAVIDQIDYANGRLKLRLTDD